MSVIKVCFVLSVSWNLTGPALHLSAKSDKGRSNAVFSRIGANMRLSMSTAYAEIFKRQTLLGTDTLDQFASITGPTHDIFVMLHRGKGIPNFLFFLFIVLRH